MVSVVISTGHMPGQVRLLGDVVGRNGGYFNQHKYVHQPKNPACEAGLIRRIE